MNNSMRGILIIFLLIPVSLFGQTDAFSLEESNLDQSDFQESDDLQDSELDSILSGSDDPGSSVEETQDQRRSEREEIPETPSDLGRLIPYEDIAVIQRRYLPKTGRFEITPSAGIVLNNAFYLLSSFGLSVGYNFSEHWGIEASGGYVHNSLKRVTKDLSNKLISVDNILFPVYFYDINVKFSPVYGKLGFFKSKILPFDMYLSLGVGQSFLDLILNVKENTTVRNQKIGSINPVNFKLGAGMMFALRKNMAFKWDVSWRSYAVNNQKVVDNCPIVQQERFSEEQVTEEGQTGGTQRVGGNTGSSIGCPETAVNQPWWPPGGEIYLTIGFSLLFPDAEYR